ncbi:MAG: LAGLIDADG family homing endonuclease [Candidatus Woesearchaeota archaeon]
MKAELMVRQGSKGLKMQRYFSKKGTTPYDQFKYTTRSTIIKEPNGTVVFQMDNLEVPEQWSQLATDILSSKYFRKAGVPGTGSEVSVKQVVKRISHSIREYGEMHKYFESREDADIFEDELAYMLLSQTAAFNSPVWFNCGLYQQYGIEGSGGNFAWDFENKKVIEINHAYIRPQCSACFIQDVEDDLMNMWDLMKSEARLFKYGSGTGTNFSKIRSKYEKLSGGGTSSGLLSFLEVFDRGAGATKSGGTTRRAAKMVILNIDHPEIEDFIDWKVREEKKAKILIQAGYDSNFNGEAYHTVSGQNSNNSIRITDEFMHAVEKDGSWQTTFRTTGEVHKTYKARYLWNKIAEAAWSCADPGVQYDTTINDWHTCPASGRINATNPCVTGDTKVLIEGGRWKRIDQLVDKETNILVNTGYIEPARIAGSFHTGHKPVYLLTTRNGYELKLTADHKVFTVNRGFVPAAELTKDDFLLLPASETAVLSEPENAVFFQMLGVYLGDGCGRDSRTIQLTMNSEHEQPILEKFASYVGETYERQTHKSHPAQVQLTKTSAKYNITNTTLVKQFSEYFDVSLASHQKVISDAIFGLNLGEQKYVLQGIFTADGTVANYGTKSQYVALDSTSKELLKGVQVLLLGFGIKSKLYPDRRAGKTTAFLPDGKGGLSEYPVREMHSLRISKDGRKKFEELIGFMPESPKQARLARLNEEVSTYHERPFEQVATLEYIGMEDVYDLTESRTHTFVANGITIHNCSEYVFLDNTACNLASINLMKLTDENGHFDLKGYQHVARIIFAAQEMLVDFSSYPTMSIAERSHMYRTIGLGYANLGTFLMVNGVPYDSEKGTAISGALTAILTGTGFLTSAEIASYLGPFEDYQKNSTSMLKVMNKHRDATYKLDVRHTPEQMLQTAREVWDEVIPLGESFGFRNAQATVLAPTGTIGLLMDCDTTGVEPDFSLVKFKKLAGGGYFKIINQSIPKALKNLGYTVEQMDDVITYMLGNPMLSQGPIDLKQAGFTSEQILRAEEAVREERNWGDWSPEINPASLKKKGVSEEDIQALGLFANGAQTVEGAPHLKESQYAAFDCANACGIGKRFIDPLGHVRMMAAVQPFLSGAISKTVNVPNSATVEDIKDIYYQGWKLGLKAIALYRDGSKGSQPLNTAEDKKKVETIVLPAKRDLPNERIGRTWEVRIGGHKMFIRTGEYEDGSLGEIFLDMHKEGASFRSLLNCFAISVSYGLQHGVPLEKYVNGFTFTKFEPNGMTDHPYVRSGTSVLDLVFRILGYTYLGRTDFLHVKPGEKQITLAPEEKVDKQTILSKEKKSNKSEIKDEQLAGMMGDAPPCNICGHITIRNGTCYKCLNCGNSMGCS